MGRHPLLDLSSWAVLCLLNDIAVQGWISKGYERSPHCKKLTSTVNLPHEMFLRYLMLVTLCHIWYHEEASVSSVLFGQQDVRRGCKLNVHISSACFSDVGNRWEGQAWFSVNSVNSCCYDSSMFKGPRSSDLTLNSWKRSVLRLTDSSRGKFWAIQLTSFQA